MTNTEVFTNYKIGYFPVPNDIFDTPMPVSFNEDNEPYTDSDGNAINKPMLPTDKLVFLFLYKMSNSFGEVFPSLQTISEKCGISRRSAIDATKRLANNGYIAKLERKIDGKENLTNQYKVALPSRAEWVDTLKTSVGVSSELLAKIHSQYSEDNLPTLSEDNSPPSEESSPNKEYNKKEYINKNNNTIINNRVGQSLLIPEPKSIVKNDEPKTFIKNEYLVKSKGFAEYVKALKNGTEIKGNMQNLYAFKKLDEAILHEDYDRVNNRDLSYIFKGMFEGYYGVPCNSFNYIGSPMVIATFIRMFKLERRFFIDIIEGLFSDYEELGYQNENFPYLDFSTLKNEKVIRPLFDGKRWGDWGNKPRVRKEASAYDGIDYKDVKKLEELEKEKPELFKLSNEEF